MPKKCLERIVISAPVLISAILIIFVALRTTPGNPVTTILEEHINQAVTDKVSREVGLNQPLYIQFFQYVGGALKGDFGTSYRLNRNVTKTILEAFPNMVKLSVYTTMVTWMIGITADIVATVKQNKPLDRLFVGCALMGAPMPIFMAALVPQHVFAFKLKLFPTSGYDSLICMVLPAIMLGWNSVGGIARMARFNLVEAMRGDYIRTTRAKGLREWGVIVHHAPKNATLSVVVMMAFQISSILSDAVPTGSVSGIPGVGRLAVNAIETRDMLLLQGTVIFATILVIAGNPIADMLYSVLDSRIREDA